VSTVEQQLRDFMQSAVGEPPHRVTVAAVRRRVIRRRVAEYVSGVAVIALLAGAGVAVAAVVSGPVRVADGGGVAGPPRYYLQTTFAGAGPERVIVRSTATGAVTAQIASPHPGVFETSSIAAADGQRFFLAWRGASTAQVYRVRLSATGQVTENAPVTGGSLGDAQVSAIAASPDGSLVAVAEYVPQSRPPRQVSDVVVINTKTGTHSVWRNERAPDGAILTNVQDLVLARGGTELGFDTLVRCRTGAVCQGGNEVRVVSPATAGGELDSSRVVFQSSGLAGANATGAAAMSVNDAVLGPDGSTVVFLTIQQSGVVVERVAVGHESRPVVLYHMKPADGYAIQSFSTDATGRFVLGMFGAAGHPSNGWIHNGRLVPLQPRVTGALGTEAW
jgi:hypothetical protein